MNLCCILNAQCFCIRCVTPHCDECIAGSQQREFEAGNQKHLGRNSLAKTYPACLNCGKTGIWKDIRYIKAARSISQRRRDSRSNTELQTLITDVHYRTKLKVDAK